MTNFGVTVYTQNRRETPTKANVEMIKFPSGEIQILEWDVPVAVSTVMVYVRGASSDTMMAAGLVLDALAREHEVSNLHVDVPYLPASRSDRGVFQASAYYLKQLMPWKEGRSSTTTITTLDAHSPAYFKQVVLTNRGKCDRVNIEAHEIIEASGFLENIKYDAVIAPDAGAKERATKVAANLGVPVFVADKKRDFATGKITKISAPIGLRESGNYLVVDDICDGGGTFAALLEAIKSRNPSAVMSFDLWVTHGVFSGKFAQNLEGYGTVMTTNSLSSAEAAQGEPLPFKLEVFDVEPLMNGTK